MAKTANSYVADQGEVVVTLSAANIVAVTAFTTAESITLDGAVRAFRRTNNPELPVAETKVTGDTSPIVTAGKTKPAEQWELVLIDDYSEGAAGEWGTDSLSAYEIFWELFSNSQHPDAIECTQAGGATGDIETTLTNPKLKAVGHAEINADSTTPAETTIMLVSETHTKAAHA